MAIISMWSPNELRRVLTYYDGEPCMEITRPLRMDAKGYRIMLDALHKYLEPKDRVEEIAVYRAVANGAAALQLPTDNQSLARLAQFVIDGADDLINMAPPEQQKRVIGEGTLWSGSRKMTFELTEDLDVAEEGEIIH